MNDRMYCYQGGIKLNITRVNVELYEGKFNVINDKRSCNGREIIVSRKTNVKVTKDTF